jgi:DNA repair protein RadD
MTKDIYRALLADLPNGRQAEQLFVAKTSGSRSNDSEDNESLDATPVYERLEKNEAARSGLFEYQVDIVDQILNAVRAESPRRILVSLPTGAGKTRTAAYAALECLNTGLVSTIYWAAPSKELLDQARETFRLLWIGFPKVLTMQLVSKLKNHPMIDFTQPAICFLTLQELSRSMKMPKQGKHTIILVDEAHHAVAPGYKKGIENLENAVRSRLTIGLSATPGRNDSNGTSDLTKFFMNSLVVSSTLMPNPVIRLQAQGVLSKLVFNSIELPKGPLGSMGVYHARPPVGIIERLQAEPRRFRKTIETITKIVKEGKRVIVFAGSIQHAIAINSALLANEISSHVVTSSTPNSDRQRYIADYRSGANQVLVNKSILLTGFDAPGTDAVFLSVPMLSPIQFEQAVGRAARGPKVGGVEVGYVYQFDDHLSIHGLPSSFHRYRSEDWK